jgi:hypothetical protein
MPTRIFRDVVGAIGYKPRTLNLKLHGQELFNSLSSPAREFLLLALRLEKGGSISVGHLYDKRWLDDCNTMLCFRRLSDDTRIEVLSFVTVMLHEVTHHLDFLTTPFGLNFHIKTMREYWSLQEFVPVLLENPELIPERFVDFDSHWKNLRASPPEASQVACYPRREGDSDELEKSWGSLRGQILTFEAWGDAGTVQPHKRHIEVGWGGNTETLTLFGRELVPITVHGFLNTLTTPDCPGWYLRPLTLLETRAIAHSMRWIIHLLGDEGADALPAYFNALHRRPGQLDDDYFFLFDLIAGAWNFASFEELLQKAPLNMRDYALRLLSTACWYALQAPPPMDEHSLLTSNPIVRLIVVLKAHAQLMASRDNRGFSSFVKFANTIDQSELPLRWGCRPIKSILAFCRLTIDAMVELNEAKTWNPDVQEHFRHVLKSLCRQFARRDDYTSYIGMPDYGNPFLGLNEPEDRELLDSYAPPEEVLDWFSFRSDLLFKYLPRQKVIERLEQHFGMNEQIIFCSCGAVISGRISKYAGRMYIRCPRCGEGHDVNPSENVKIHVE